MPRILKNWPNLIEKRREDIFSDQVEKKNVENLRKLPKISLFKRKLENISSKRIEKWSRNLQNCQDSLSSGIKKNQQVNWNTADDFVRYGRVIEFNEHLKRSENEIEEWNSRHKRKPWPISKQ